MAGNPLQRAYPPPTRRPPRTPPCMARPPSHTEKTQLGCLEHAVGIQTASNGLAICEPESQAHRARHENAVPAEAQRTQLDGDGARGVKHTGHLYGPVTVLSNKSRSSGQIR